MTRKRIVVGVDGSAASQAALAWAVVEARATGGVVDAVIAWSLPAGYGWGTVIPDGPRGFEVGAGKVLSDAVKAVSNGGAPVEIRQHVVQGRPAQALIARAIDADLLVVGNRGHGGFTGLLLGSVSNQVVHHAPCPVVVIREPVEQAA